MGNPNGFLSIGRAKVPRRPVHERIADYQQVYLPLPDDELNRQAARCMDCGVPFCNTGCPLNNLIPEWNDLVYNDRWREAIDRLHATNNFPEFTGTLCPAPCENACVLSINDAPVTIKEIEHSIIDRAFIQGWVVPQPPVTRSGKCVAIIGSGPAGLAAAQQLNRAGHLVTVFEKDDTIGGLLVYGIPDFKIEKWVVERRVQQLREEGIEFRAGIHVGVDVSIAQLREEYDAIVLAVGALAGRDASVPGRELDGVHLAMDYLVQQNRRVAGRPVHGDVITASGKRVVILGGGDTGADCLGNVNREEAHSVRILTRGAQPPEAPHPHEWPEVPQILRLWPAHEEGGERQYDVTVAGFSGSNGRVESVQLRDVRTGEEHSIEADLVLLAIGFSGPVLDDLFTEVQPEMSDNGAVWCDDNFATSSPGVFVTGDAMRGASLIVWAIADGRKAARSVDVFLMGESNLPA